MWWINTSVFILHESNVNIVDADILHVDGEVGHDGEGGPVEEEEGALEGEQVHVRPEAATLRGTVCRILKKRKMKTKLKVWQIR